MSRLIIVIMEENQYPFGECDNSMLQKKKVMVRKRIDFHPFQKKNMLLKAKKIKGFINPYIIKLQQLLEQDTSLHLLFEYVPIKIQTWISNINPEFIENYRIQLLQLADYLADNSILIDFKLKNIGMDQNYLPKYFIGLEYEINTLMGKDLLLEKYKTQINEIINPYRANNFEDKKIRLAPEPNPQFPKKNQETLKRQTQKSVKEFISIKTPTRSSQAQKINFCQRDSIKKVSNLSQNDLKLTFDGSQKVLFENLPKNISTNIKIENIGRKINDLKNMIQKISGENMQRKHDSVSSSPMKGLNDERPNSSYQKFLARQLVQSGSKGVKVQKTTNMGPDVDKINSKELRQTQSESEYSGRFVNCHGLDRSNEKMHINEVRTKNQVRVIGGSKQSYIYEFQRLLNDDIDQFATREVSFQTNQEANHDSHEFKTPQQIQQKSPRFGLSSCPINIENIKTQPERFSYSHTNKKRKKPSESALSGASQIQDRVNAVIGASKTLISNFRKGKINEKKQFVPKLE